MARLAAAVVLALALAAGAAGGTGSMSGWFFVEGRGLYCGTELFPHERSSPWLVCWRPHTGFVVSMTSRGRARVDPGRDWRHRPPVYDSALRPGETAWVDRRRRTGRGVPPRASLFWCAARTTSLTCTNAAGYGWRLGRLRGVRLIVPS